MRLDRLTPAHVRRAVELYMARAWPPGLPRALPQRVTPDMLDGATTMEELLARFEEGAGEDKRMRRFWLRLGNARYPFMKFVVQEYLVGEEFFFSVDTHDNLDVRPDSPDYAEWERLKVFNRELRERIESDWEAAKLPTQADLCTLVEELALVEREESKRRRLLVVDDEESVARGLAALLRARTQLLSSEPPAGTAATHAALGQRCCGERAAHGLPGGQGPSRVRAAVL